MAEIQSLARGLKIMELLAASTDAVSVTELADELGIDKSSASRLVQTLANHGYAEQDAQSRRYRLGPQIVRLSRSLLTRMPLRNEADPFLHNLSTAPANARTWPSSPKTRRFILIRSSRLHRCG